jgi:hypothetical protein
MAARQKRQAAQASERLLRHVDSLSDGPESIAPMEKEAKEMFIRGALLQTKLDEPDQYVATIRKLLLDIEANYVLSMKFSIVKEKCIKRNGFPDAYILPNEEFGPLLAPFLPQLPPYYGLVEAMPVSSLRVAERVPILAEQDYLTKKLYLLLRDVHNRFDQINMMRILDVDRGNCAAILHMGTDLGMGAHAIAKKLRELQSDKPLGPQPAYRINDFLEHMKQHKSQVVRILHKEWRDSIIADVQDRLSEDYNFFIDSPPRHMESDLHRLLKRLDLGLNHQMKTFVGTSLFAWVGFIKSFLTSPQKILPEPLLVLNITVKEGNQVAFDPSPEQLMDAMIELTLSLVDSANQVFACEHEMVPCCNLDPIGMYNVTRTSPSVVSAERTVRQVIDQCLVGPLELLEQYREYEYLLQKGPANVDPCDIDRVEGNLAGTVLDKVEQYVYAKEGIENTSATMMKFPMFEVHCNEIIERLSKRADDLTRRVLDKVNDSAENRTTQLSEKWSACQDTVRNAVQNEKELSDLKEYMKDIEKIVNPQVNTLKQIRTQMDLLESFQYSVRPELVEEVFEAGHWPLTIKVDVSARIREIDKEKIKFMDQLAVDKEVFMKDMKKWQSKLEFVKNEMTAFEEAKNYDKDVSGFHEALMDGRRRIEDFNQRESLFGIELTERDELEEIIEEYEPYFKMWSTAIEFTYNQESWLSMQLTQLPSDDVFAMMDQWYKAAYKMVKTFSEDPIQKGVIEAMLKGIKKFKENVPIIESLCHPAIQPRHWFELFDE